MGHKIGSFGDGNPQSQEKIVFVQQMLGQLSAVARNEKADMLGYLIDMAYEEARDVLKRMDRETLS